MIKLADSHIHLFDGGYLESGADEVRDYEALMRTFPIEAALVVGYEGLEWARGNNDFVADLAQSREWIRPVAFVFPEELTLKKLHALQEKNFIGISLYIFTEDDIRHIKNVPDEVWRWLSDNRWLMSVNSKGEILRVWLGIFEKYPELHLLISHLGSPDIKNENVSTELIAKHLEVQRELHRYKNVYLKLSAFYALEPTKPPFPYKRSARYIEYVLKNFEQSRLIWGSDFTPALADVTFEETFTTFNEWLDNDAQLIEKVMHGNLMRLLD